MSFTRTNSGLSNMALFEGVDIIVFVEGGKDSFCIENIMTGAYNNESIDSMFWKKLFQKHGIDKRMQFRAVGSKTTLKVIADKICNGVVDNVIVACDKDLDHHCGTQIVSPKILYTHGYSWENDVWHRKVLFDFITSNYPGAVLPEDKFAEMTRLYDKFEQDIRRFVYVDILCHQNQDCFIPRNSGEEMIEVVDSRPYFNKGRAFTLLRNKRRNRTQSVLSTARIVVQPLVDCYGKVISSFGYRLLYFAFKIKKTSREVINSWAITHFSTTNLNAVSPDISEHYKYQFDNLKLSLD